MFKVSTGAYQTKAAFRSYRIGYVPDRGGRVMLDNDTPSSVKKASSGRDLPGRGLHAGETGAFNALGKVFLEQNIQDNQRDNRQQTDRLNLGLRGVYIDIQSQIVHVGQPCLKAGQRGGDHLHLAPKEGGRRVVVVPVPDHRQEHHGQHDVFGGGHHHPQKRAVGVASVDRRRLFQFLGKAEEELAVDEDIQAGAQPHAQNGRKDSDPRGADQVNLRMEAGDAVKQRNNAERIKEAVLQVHGSGDGLLRHDNGKDHQREKEAASAEIEAGQAVGHVTVTYGKPIIPGELTKEEKKEIGNYTKNILLEQLKENA